MTLAKMCEQLGIEKFPAVFERIYEEIKNSYREHAAVILSEKFITDALDSCSALKAYREPVLKAAKKIRASEALSLLVCLLEEWVHRNDSLPGGEYEPPVGEGVEYDFLHLFAAIPRIPENLAYLRGRKVPEDVIAMTMGEFDYCVELFLNKFGRPVFRFDRLNWINRLLHNKMIRIERFKYDLPGNYLTGVKVYRNQSAEVCILADQLEIHKSGRVLGSVGHADAEGSFFAEVTETEKSMVGHRVKADGIVEFDLCELSKEEWSLCLSEKDPVLRIHIPPDGSFDRESIHRAYERARKVFTECYPDLEYKAFFCSSWLMSGDLWEILKPSSNILGFQSDFLKIPHRSSGGLVFMFAFSAGPSIPEDIASLPEENSMQRKIKERYLNGGYIHEGAGFFF